MLLRTVLDFYSGNAFPLTSENALVGNASSCSVRGLVIPELIMETQAILCVPPTFTSCFTDIPSWILGPHLAPLNGRDGGLSFWKARCAIGLVLKTLEAHFLSAL